MDQVQIFIIYAREDQEKAKEIYRRLARTGYKPWLDEEDLLPGQNFRLVIERSLTASDFVIICLSQASVAKRSLFQWEIKQAMDKLGEMLPEDIFIIPARLDECDVPAELQDRHWVDLFEERGWEKLFKALDHELRKRGKTPPPQTARESEPPKPVKARPMWLARFAGLIPASRRARVIIAAVAASVLFTVVCVSLLLLNDKPANNISTSGVQPKVSETNDFTEDLGNGVKLEMVNLQGGEFTMGSDEGEFDERPRHKVKVSPFAIGKYEVTQGQWKALMGVNPSRFNQSDESPVENVSWNMVQDFIRRLNDKISNGTYRLPTEAEWEYAARAGSQSRYSFGDNADELRNYAWFFDNSGYQMQARRTHPVGRLQLNAFGLFDMHGNVWEWCSDWYSSSYYAECEQKGTVIDPQGPITGSGRVIRGGGWRNVAVACRSAIRDGGAPDFRHGYLGFRLERGPNNKQRTK